MKPGEPTPLPKGAAPSRLSAAAAAFASGQGQQFKGGSYSGGGYGGSPGQQDEGGGGGGGSGSSGYSSGYYDQLLANDPQLQAALAAIAAQRAAYQGQLSGSVQQALEMYGQIPTSLAAQFSQFVTPTVQSLAQQATQGGVSTVAQLAKAYQQQHANDLNALAARGILRSGATGVHENADLQNYNTAGYNALQSLLTGLGGQYSGYLGQMDVLNQQAETATSDALNRIIQQINNGSASSGGGGGGSSSGGGATGGTAAPSYTVNNWKIPLAPVSTVSGKVLGPGPVAVW